MDVDFKLDKVIEVMDLVKRLSWGAVPLWFALTLPTIYIAYVKLLPEQQPTGDTENTGMQKIIKWFSLPRVDKIVIYTSLLMFIAGTITLLIDQNEKEKIRNNGLRIKQYLISKTNYAVSRKSLVDGNFRLLNLSSKDIDQVLDLYPNEFIEVDRSTIILRDSLLLSKIMLTSEKLLDNYLSNPYLNKTQPIDGLIKQSNFFTREVVYKLIVDSPRKYTFCLTTCNEPSVALNSK